MTRRTFLVAAALLTFAVAPAADAPAFVDRLRAFVAVRDKYAALLGRPVPIVAYEGGLALVPTGDAAACPWYQACLAAPLDPAIYPAYRRWLAAQEAAGVDGVIQFDFIDPPGPFGTYGLLPSQDSPPTPRYRALLDYIRGH